MASYGCLVSSMCEGEGSMLHCAMWLQTADMCFVCPHGVPVLIAWAGRLSQRSGLKNWQCALFYTNRPAHSCKWSPRCTAKAQSVKPVRTWFPVASQHWLVSRGNKASQKWTCLPLWTWLLHQALPASLASYFQGFLSYEIHVEKWVFPLAMLGGRAFKKVMRSLAKSEFCWILG